MTREKKKALFGGPFGVALVVAVLASIAAIPLLMKLAPSADELQSTDSGAALDSDVVAGTDEGRDAPVEPAADSGTASGSEAGSDAEGNVNDIVDTGTVAEAKLSEGDATDAGNDDADARLASLDVDAPDGNAAKDTLAIKEFSATSKDTNSMIGGRIVIVSASGPGVVVFDDGTRYTPGTVMPNGHVISSIESDQIILERENTVSVVRLE